MTQEIEHRVQFENHSDEIDFNEAMKEGKFVICLLKFNREQTYKYKMYCPINSYCGIPYSSDRYKEADHILTGYIGVFTERLVVEKIHQIVEAKDVKVDVSDRYMEQETSEKHKNQLLSIRR